MLGFAGLAAPEVNVLVEAVTVEEPVVPQQGCVFGGWFHPAQAAALGVAPYGPVQGGKRVWLSGSALPDRVAHVQGEAAVEARLAAAGWTILRAETLSLPRQLAALAGAERIVGLMDSALHLLLLFDVVPARVSILSRGLHRDLVRPMRPSRRPRA
nr:glycosyltransferase 61 family protein [Roseomonas rubea]